MSDGSVADIRAVSQAFVSSMRQAPHPPGQNRFDLGNSRTGRDDKMSDRAIAEMCAVSDKTVAAMRRALSPSIAEIPQCSTRTTSDGRQYPAQRKTPGKVVTRDGKNGGR
ncbi:MAG: hypothetical protein JXA57_07135 [Armatimonadetes bacterium]|nr:hypothetical protein [Armatimonadota bacterium]